MSPSSPSSPSFPIAVALACGVAIGGAAPALVKFASGYTYRVPSSAVHRDGKDTVITGRLASGVRFPFLLQALSWSADLGGYRLLRIDVPRSSHDEVVKAHLRISSEIARHFSIVAGGGAHVAVRGDSTLTSKFGPELCAGLVL